MQLLWHHGVNAGIFNAERFVALTAYDPAAHSSGMTTKGQVAPGFDADILLWDPTAEYTISAATQAMNTDYSMFEGWKVRGNTHSVYSRGELVVTGGRFNRAAPAAAKFLHRKANAGELI